MELITALPDDASGGGLIGQRGPFTADRMAAALPLTSADLLILIQAYYYMDLISYSLNIHCIVKIKNTYLYMHAIFWTYFY